MFLRARRVIVVVAVFTSVCCGGKAPTSASPSTPESGSLGLNLTGFQARQVGLVDAVCGSSNPTYYVIDQLSFQVTPADKAGLVGGSIVSHENGSVSTVGLIKECATTTQHKCALLGSPSICYESTSGQVQVFIQSEWSSTRTWSINVAAGSSSSNTASATIIRPDGLPAGDSAAIVFLNAHRTSSSGGNIDWVVYSPGVSGRTIETVREVRSGGATLSSLSGSSPEVAGSHSITTVGGLVIGAGSTEILLTVTERNADGSVHASDSRSIVIPAAGMTGT